MKVVLTLGDTPADCNFEVDGNKVLTTEVRATVTMEDGPTVEYVNTAGEIKTIEFSPKIEDAVEVL